VIAALPMYDLPELRSATDAWWSALAAALRRAGFAGVPERLSRADDLEALWTHPGLLLAQTCGYPLVTVLSGRVGYVATPWYRVPDCVGACYASWIVVPAAHGARGLADLEGAICAVSTLDSHSGYNVLRAEVAAVGGRRGFFRRLMLTGSHAASLETVGRGGADLCCVDAVTHALLARYRPAVLAGTRVLATTRRAPGLPYVTAGGRRPEEMVRLRCAVLEAQADPGLAPVRDSLLLGGFEVLPEGAYGRIAGMEADAIAAGCQGLV
jgi:ABC-type phosphate/phosphonate transport system substrate-binding protein